MLQMINKKLRNRKGFTLIELIVVIAILGILAAIAIPRLLTFTNSAEEAADRATAASIARAAQLNIAESTTNTLDAAFDDDAYVEGSTKAWTVWVLNDNNVVVQYGNEYYPETVTADPAAGDIAQTVTGAAD